MIFNGKGYYQPVLIEIDDGLSETSTGINPTEEYTLTYKIDGAKTKPATITLTGLELIKGFAAVQKYVFDFFNSKSIDDIRREAVESVVLWGTLKQDKTSATKKKLKEAYSPLGMKTVEKALKGSKTDSLQVKAAISAYLFCQMVSKDGDCDSRHLVVVDHPSPSQEMIDSFTKDWESAPITKQMGFTSVEEFLEKTGFASNGYLTTEWVVSDDINKEAA